MYKFVDFFRAKIQFHNYSANETPLSASPEIPFAFFLYELFQPYSFCFSFPRFLDNLQRGEKKRKSLCGWENSIYHVYLNWFINFLSLLLHLSRKSWNTEREMKIELFVEHSLVECCINFLCFIFRKSLIYPN